MLLKPDHFLADGDEAGLGLQDGKALDLLKRLLKPTESGLVFVEI